MNGDLSEYPFPLLLSVLGKQTGALTLEVADGTRVSLTLHQGHVRHVHQNATPVRSLSRVQGLVRQMLEVQEGEFEFRAVKELRDDGLDVPVTTLLLAVMAEQDVLEQLEAKLPHPNVRYAATDLPVVLDNALDAFYNRAYTYLEVGATAAELARHLDLDIKDVQLKMLRLIEVGSLETESGSTGHEDEVVSAHGNAAD